MKIVKFKNGKFGVKTGCFFWRGFLDLYDIGVTWSQTSHVAKYCQGTREQALTAINNNNLKFEVCED